MKTLRLFLVVAAAACAVVGCGDSASEGWDANTGAVDASDDAFTIYGDVEPDESPPPDSAESEESPDPCSPEKVAEVCAPYLGVWDCDGVDGYIEGGHGYVVLDFLQATDCTMSFSMTNVGQSGFDTVTCDPNHMPPVDSWLLTTYELKSDDQLKVVLTNPTPPPLYGTLLCSRVTQ